MSLDGQAKEANVASYEATRQLANHLRNPQPRKPTRSQNKMLFFGGLIYSASHQYHFKRKTADDSAVSCLLVNAIAILSEDRFLARSTFCPPRNKDCEKTNERITPTVGLSPSSYDPAFGQNADSSIRAKIVQLIASVRTLMRSMVVPSHNCS
jgi:hypothetical protein